MNSRTSSGIFDFDTFWKNLKSKLGFINWDAINKGQGPAPSTRALLYFSRLWEDFKHNTPFLNWKAIVQGAEAPSVRKRASRAAQNYNYYPQPYPTAPGAQYPYPYPNNNVPAKEVNTVSNYASGPEAYNAQFLNIDKLRSAFKTDEFLNWHALFEIQRKKQPS
ncbi:dermokine [Sorex fumeus]|uniref:dermokine n=1 Tax=Sorex fumeus TaxID=62283 RepID=UPI0024ADCB05|nr:dermokine [Sorex fumeus]